jgi:hypothetical protein
MRNRIQSYLADHLRTVQYPHETHFTSIRGTFRSQHEDIPIFRRIGMVLFFLFWVIVISAAIIVMGILGWAFIGAALGLH